MVMKCPGLAAKIRLTGVDLKRLFEDGESSFSAAGLFLDILLVVVGVTGPPDGLDGIACAAG